MDLKGDLCELEVQSKKIPGLDFADPGSVAVGDVVLVAGNPRGLQGTFSKGIVSALREERNLVQIDAPISPGSSGGPVVNEAGLLVGVATASMRDGQNLNFAIRLSSDTTLPRVDLTIADLGYISLSDIEIRHLIGPCKMVTETVVSGDLEDDSEPISIIGEPGPPQGAVLLTPVKNRLVRRTAFNRAGMVTSDLSNGFGSNAWRRDFEFFEDDRVPIQITDWSPGKNESRGKHFSWESGVHERIRMVRDALEGTSPREERDMLGNVLRVTYTEDSVNILEYESGFLAREVFRERGRVHRISEYSYRFDKRGNWIERTRVTRYPLAPGGPKTGIDEVLSREIDYYE